MARLTGYSILSRLLAVVLILSGGLKGYELFFSPDSFAAGALAGPLLTAWAAFAVLFGLWVICGAWPRQTSWVLAARFAILFVLALRSAWLGEESSGCFGPIPLAPWAVAVIYGVALLALLWWYPQAKPDAVSSHRLRLTVFAGVAGVAMLAAAALWHSFAPVTLAEDADEVDDGRVVWLAPQQWVGRPFPLVRHIDGGARLGSGTWIIMFHHWRCARCREHIPQYVALGHV
jgi:uncharacterized membrane protein YphA (DoxX/SURF4 family)